MALKDTITKWHRAMTLLHAGSHQASVSKLMEINQPSAKILHNAGCIKALMGDWSSALQFFSEAVDLDKYLALSYYQRAFCYHQLNKYDRAELDFLTAKSMINTDCIDYNQLGAKMVLTCEIIDDCVAALRTTVTQNANGARQPLPACNILDCVFYPPKQMVANLAKQDFLGKAKIISSVNEYDISKAAEKGGPLTVYADDFSKPASLPSSPATAQRKVQSRSGAQIFVHPPPNRPPPRLSTSCSLLVPSVQPMRKSRSAEHIVDSADEHLYDEIEETAMNHVSGTSVSAAAFRASKSNVQTRQYTCHEYTQCVPNSTTTTDRGNPSPGKSSLTLEQTCQGGKDALDRTVQLPCSNQIQSGSVLARAHPSLLSSLENKIKASSSSQSNVDSLNKDSALQTRSFPLRQDNTAHNQGAQAMPTKIQTNQLSEMRIARESTPPNDSVSHNVFNRGRQPKEVESRLPSHQPTSTTKPPKPARPPPPKFSK